MKLIVILLAITVFIFICFLLSWINEKKACTIILSICCLICFAGVGYLGWKHDRIEKFQIVKVEEVEKFNEPTYEFTLKGNQGDTNKIWIRESDMNSYDNNSMFIEAIENYREGNK